MIAIEKVHFNPNLLVLVLVLVLRIVLFLIRASLPHKYLKHLKMSKFPTSILNLDFQIMGMLNLDIFNALVKKVLGRSLIAAVQ
ncbi:hypothetical protein Ccrd_015628 [Cynara cardunculus var. scolymus]|uniref:Uncharacterized protein n=1 Tax=Cynara cardunculus var. scolymus TaxID=59895 RepID=A0A118K3I9_CYNCS|nr:hypothetical protein Ccrd_015628 [Cynara cardunculus var. scolymus]